MFVIYLCVCVIMSLHVLYFGRWIFFSCPNNFPHWIFVKVEKRKKNKNMSTNSEKGEANKWTHHHYQQPAVTLHWLLPVSPIPVRVRVVGWLACMEIEYYDVKASDSLSLTLVLSRYPIITCIKLSACLCMCNACMRIPGSFSNKKNKYWQRMIRIIWRHEK